MTEGWTSADAYGENPKPMHPPQIKKPRGFRCFLRRYGISTFTPVPKDASGCSPQPLKAAKTLTGRLPAPPLCQCHEW